MEKLAKHNGCIISALSLSLGKGRDHKRHHIYPNPLPIAELI
jgi:hypothetical protein